MQTGVGLIAAERQRHFDEEGWTAAHDDTHVASELPNAAVCYILAKTAAIVGTYWPSSWGNWWKPTTRIRNLVKAGALLAAEIDRLLRSEGHGHGQTE